VSHFVASAGNMEELSERVVANSTPPESQATPA